MGVRRLDSAMGSTKASSSSALWNAVPRAFPRLKRDRCSLRSKTGRFGAWRVHGR